MAKYCRPKIRLCRERLKYVESVKYLGVYIDDGLKFNTHIKVPIARVKKAVTNLLTLSKVSDGYGCDI